MVDSDRGRRIRCRDAEITRLLSVRWLEPATADLQAIATYVGANNPHAARRLATRLRDVADSLSGLPERGRPGKVPGTRELVAVPPYVIIYQAQDDVVDIPRIWHAAQDRP